MGEPLVVVAQMLDRSRGMVKNMRAMVRHGDPRIGRNFWSEEDSDRLRDTPKGTPGRVLLEMFPGRSLSSIYARLGEVTSEPYRIKRSGRTLVAQTCTKCGLLRAAEWYRPDSEGYLLSQCRQCLVDKNKQYEDQRKAWYEEMQNRSSETAERHGYELTDFDHQVLSDPELTDFEKAVKLRRTYIAVVGSRKRFGYASKRPSLAELDLGEWLVIPKENRQ